jgi:hypothetical protein
MKGGRNSSANWRNCSRRNGDERASHEWVIGPILNGRYTGCLNLSQRAFRQAEARNPVAPAALAGIDMAQELLY